MSARPKLGLSLMSTPDFHQASAELFESGRVEVVEWSFDNAFNGAHTEPWCQDIVDRYSDANALLGHGVTLSPLSVRFSQRQQDWLAGAAEEFRRHNYIHASEHFGFSEAGPVAHGAPLAVPMNAATLKSGKEKMKRFAEATRRPVGLENLAFAFCLEDVKRQGEFIDHLLSEVDGFLLLDLHNLYCQQLNFNIPAIELLESYPLERVREIHISGGSFSPAISGRRIFVRRDTHDEQVPQEVFELAVHALKRCPEIEYVIYERLGFTMEDEESQAEYREDFETLAQLLEMIYV